MYRILALLSFLCFTYQLAAQQYTTSDKRAIKFFEEAVSFLNKHELGPGLQQIDKAIERDPKFVEAWLLKADLHIESRQMDEAIQAMEMSVQVMPEFFPNKYFTLGQLYMQQGEYEKAHENYNALLSYSQVRSELQQHARHLIRSCEFAMEAIKNPVPFEPRNLGSGVNSEMPEYYPSMTVDGKQLLFTREVPVSPNHQRGQEDFYISEWSGESWGAAEPLHYINTPGNEGAPAISPDGQSMIFTACDLYGSYGPERDGFGSCDLFYTYKIGQRWAKAQNMGTVINSAHWESQPSISADGKTLYFVRGDRNPMKRTSDLYMSVLGDDGSWQKPVKLSETINTPYNEESVFIHPDGKTLYFSSDGHPGMGGLDIFVSTRIGENEWTEPVNLGYPINTSADENSLLVSPMGDIAFFSSSRYGGFGSLDLYAFDLPETVRPDPVTSLNGLVYDAETKQPLYALFELIDIESGEVVVTSHSNTEDGSFLVALPFNRRYALNASKKGYLFYSDHFDLLKEGEYFAGKVIEVPMHKVSDGHKMVLNNVFFDTDKYNLKPESQAELNKLADFMKQNEGVKIEIGGHTDNQGSASHNQQLSENRAKSVMNFLTDNGIDKGRLSAKGYGQDQPVADNATPEGRAKNRRTEVKVVGN